MIDTIILIIPRDKFIFLDLSNEGVSNWHLQSHTDAYMKYIKNPKVLAKRTGKYYPRLTEYVRKYGNDRSVKIELSLPKLIFLNNLDELEDKDFDRVVETLQSRLKEMGVVVERKDIEVAKVGSVHFSKNILLQDGYTSNYVISEIGKIDLRKTFDFARARYINDGQSLCAHTTSHEFVVYDKIADLHKGQKRAIDKDQTSFQLSLFKAEKKVSYEVVRFEIRLAKKQKMNSVLTKIGYEKDPIFKDVFSSDLSMKVVSLYWEGVVQTRNIGLFATEMSNKEKLRKIYKHFPNIKPARAIYLVGLLNLAREQYGMGELRSIVSAKSGDRTWYRIMSDFRSVSELIALQDIRGWVGQVNSAFTKYRPLRLQLLSKEK